MSAAGEKRYYVLTLRGDLGPFDRATLAEKLRDGSVQPNDQVRNAFGRVQGTVAEALELRQERHTAPQAPRSGPHRVQEAARSRPGAPHGGARWLPLALGALLLAFIAVLALARRAPEPAPDAAAPSAMAPKPLATATRTAQRAAPPPATGPQLVIRKAVYGVLPDHVFDVTRIVAAAVREDRLSIRADNAVLGDPIYGQAKQLRVDYRWRGEDRTKTADENDLLTIFDQGR